MKKMDGYHIEKAYFRTYKRHTNRPDEVNILNVDIKKNDGSYKDHITEIYLDKGYLAIIPISEQSGIFQDDTGEYTIQFHIDKPENLDTIPFRYEMKMYPMFGRHFEIVNGKKSNERYKK